MLSVTKIAGGHAHNVIPAEVRSDGHGAHLRSRDAGHDRAIAARHGGRASRSPAAPRSRYAMIAIIRRRSTMPSPPRSRWRPPPQCAATSPRRPTRRSPRRTSRSCCRRGPAPISGSARGAAPTARALHHPRYDFNDGVIGTGIAWFAELAERSVAAPQRSRVAPPAYICPLRAANPHNDLPSDRHFVIIYLASAVIIAASRRPFGT